MRNYLADVQALIGAADATDDVEARVLYLARARAEHVRLVGEVQACTLVLLEKERELARLAKLAAEGNK